MNSELDTSKKSIGFILTAVVLIVFFVVVMVPQSFWVELSLKLFP